jgi:hypothetical protein
MKKTLRIAIVAMAAAPSHSLRRLHPLPAHAGTVIVKARPAMGKLAHASSATSCRVRTCSGANASAWCWSLVSFADAYTGKYPVLHHAAQLGRARGGLIPFNFPAANPGVNDILALCKVPAGVKIVDWTIVTTEDATATAHRPWRSRSAR